MVVVLSRCCGIVANQMIVEPSSAPIVIQKGFLRKMGKVQLWGSELMAFTVCCGWIMAVLLIIIHTKMGSMFGGGNLSWLSLCPRRILLAGRNVSAACVEAVDPLHHQVCNFAGAMPGLIAHAISKEAAQALVQLARESRNLGVELYQKFLELNHRNEACLCGETRCQHVGPRDSAV